MARVALVTGGTRGLAPGIASAEGSGLFGRRDLHMPWCSSPPKGRASSPDRRREALSSRQHAELSREFRRLA